MSIWRRILIGTLLVILCGGAVLWGWWHHHITQFDALLEEAGSTYHVEPRLLACVIWRESRFQPGAIGRAGEMGLMQVTPTVGWEWAANHGIDHFQDSDLLDPRTNVLAGAWYLATALAQWAHRPDPLPYALAQYNAGRSNALRWARDDDDDAERFIGQITFPGTRAYVSDIIKRYRDQ